ncbi:uncharacterized protein LOC134221495 [Armigeres subalbatus]|uniref:uncharacterized protein LOC134221495 n=1 Tax=Armigeres subalbatus TaxID=124917 RepID=UPI002ECFB432
MTLVVDSLCLVGSETHTLHSSINNQLRNLRDPPVESMRGQYSQANVERANEVYETSTLLSLGPKFAIPTDVTIPRNLFHIIADVESILNTSPYKTVRDYTRCKITTAIQNHISRTRSKQMESPLEKFCKHAVTTTRKFLEEHRDIVVVESDKGKRMVVMCMEDYERKMTLLLTDSTYKTLPKDPTQSTQRHNNALVKRLNNLNLIDQTTANRLNSSTATCPRIYGQPKAHKEGIPLRPVVPNINAPTYQLSKFIATILSNSFHSNYNITDSFMFVQYIKAVTLPAGYVLVSFDVVSLFTNIPKDLVMHDIIMNWDQLGKTTNICLDIFLELVSFCLDNSYFQFRDKYYQQTFGTAMGSPLAYTGRAGYGNTTADCDKETEISHSSSQKYVDDLILALPPTKLKIPSKYSIVTISTFSLL